MMNCPYCKKQLDEIDSLTYSHKASDHYFYFCMDGFQTNILRVGDAEFTSWSDIEKVCNKLKAFS